MTGGQPRTTIAQACIVIMIAVSMAGIVVSMPATGIAAGIALAVHLACLAPDGLPADASRLCRASCAWSPARRPRFFAPVAI